MREKFLSWWQRPVQTRDRVGAIAVGAFGGMWVGLLLRLFFGPMPVSLPTLGYWAIGGIAAGMLLGALFPRATTIVLFPFSTFGAGS